MTCELPPAVGGDVHQWHRLLDSSMDSPDDMHRVTDAPRLSNMHYTAAPFSVVLLSRPYAEPEPDPP